MAEHLSFGLGPLVRGAVLLARRVTLFRSHYRIARGYTSRRNAAKVAWSWALMLKAAHGVDEPAPRPLTQKENTAFRRAVLAVGKVIEPDAGVAPSRKITSLAEFCAEGERLGLTAFDLAEALKDRPEFADCLPQLDAASVKAGEPEDVRAWLDSRRNAGVPGSDKCKS